MSVEDIGIFLVHTYDDDEDFSMNATPEDRERMRRLQEWQENSQKVKWTPGKPLNP